MPPPDSAERCRFWVRGVFGRSLIEQSAAERIGWALGVAVLLWLAIWWALS